MSITYINAHQVGAGTFQEVTIVDGLTVDSTTLVIDEDNNRVGVGTAAPAKDVHVSRASGETTLRLQSGSFYSDIHQSATNLFIQNAATDGNIIFYDDAAERMRIDGDGLVGIGRAAPHTALDVVHDYDDDDFEAQLDNDEGGGDILKFGTGTTVAGEAFYLENDGSWLAARANDTDTGGSQLLAIALGTSPTTDGMILRGFVRLAAANIQGTPNEGLPCYVSDTASKGVQFTAPNSSGDFVRVVGHCIDLNGGGDALIYWNPSNDVIELA